MTSATIIIDTIESFEKKFGKKAAPKKKGKGKTSGLPSQNTIDEGGKSQENYYTSDLILNGVI